MKQKNNLLSRLLFVPLGISLIASCQKEVVSTIPDTTDAQESFSIGIEIDSIPIMPLEAEVVKSQSTEEEHTVQTARALEFTVPSNSNYPKLVAKDGKDSIPLHLILYSADYPNDRTFYSKDVVYFHIKNGYISRPTQKVEFIGGTYRRSDGKTLTWKLANGELLFNNKDKFRLTALYAPGATRNGTTINFEASSPQRFFSEGEKFIVGKDINIPFVLGTVRGAERSPGVPLTLQHNSKTSPSLYYRPEEYNNPENYSFSFKRTNGAAFYPLGTLFAMRFQNNMKGLSDLNSQMDPVYWQGSNGNLKMATYNYKINEVRIRSTSTKGTFSLENRALNFSPNEIKTYKFRPQKDKEVLLKIDKKETPWIYFWQYSQGGADDSSIEVSLNMLNTTLGVDNTALVYRAKGSSFKNSHKYYKTIALTRELRLPPLATLAPTFIAYHGQNIAWGNSWESNTQFAEGDGSGPDAADKRGIGGSYNAKDLQNNNYYLLNPFTVKSLASGDYDKALDKTKWVLPRPEALEAYFPPFITGITAASDRYHSVYEGTRTDRREVIVNGVRMIDNALYRSPSNQNDLTGQNQTAGNSIRVFYGIRYIGTQYVSAYRYIEYGKWRPATGSPDLSTASRLIIQSRSLPLSAGMKNGNYDEATAKKYLEDVIAKNEFWSDNVGNGTTLSTANCRDYKPDVIERILPLTGELQYDGRIQGIGEQTQIWTYPIGVTNYSRDNLPYFRISNGRSSTYVPQKVFGFASKNFSAMILPILMPGQGEH